MSFEEVFGKDAQQRYKGISYFKAKMRKIRVFFAIAYLILGGMVAGGLMSAGGNTIVAILIPVASAVGMYYFAVVYGWAWYWYQLKGGRVSVSAIADSAFDAALYSRLTTGSSSSGLMGIVVGLLFMVTIGLFFGFVCAIRYELEYLKLKKRFHRA